MSLYKYMSGDEPACLIFSARPSYALFSIKFSIDTSFPFSLMLKSFIS